MTFKQWFEDMEIRYQASYGSYEELLQEAFEAGAKLEREACAKAIDEMHLYGFKDVREFEIATLQDAARTIRARGEA